MMKKLLVIFLTVYIPVPIVSQRGITGNVYDSKQKAIEGAVVTLTYLSQDMIGYTVTDGKGYFSVLVPESRDSLILNVSLLGFRPVSIRMGSKPKYMVVRLEEADIQLKEIKIVPPVIRQKNDTLVYNVEEFRTQQDQTIGSILKKIPGVEVTIGGGVKYNGLPINKFYIEGLDLLDDKYNIATDNIPADVVTGIEVLENHQPVRSVRDVLYSEQAAINLKLKKNKISSPIGHAEAWGGVENDRLIRLLDSFGMLLGSKNQTIVTYKANNKGQDVAAELTEHELSIDNAVNKYREPLTPIFNVSGGSNPNLGESRYLFNRTHAVSVNNLTKLSENSGLRVNADYINDKREETVSSRNVYYLGDSVFDIKESALTIKKVNQLNGSLDFTNNGEKHYFRNTLKTKVKWNKSFSDITQQAYRTSQRFNVPELNFQNEMKIYKTPKKRIFNLNVYTRYSSLPQYLLVQADDNSLFQSLSRKNFYTNVNTSFYYNRGYSKYGLTAKAEADMESLKSSLENAGMQDSINNFLSMNKFIFTLVPNYNFKKGRFSLDVSLALTGQITKLNDKAYENRGDYDYFYIRPRLSAKYRISPFIEVFTGYSHSRDLGDLNNLGKSYILTSYRYMVSYPGILSQTERNTFSAGINYKNQLKNLFFNTRFSFTPSRLNLVPVQSMQGEFILSGQQGISNNRRNIFWYSYIGKYVSSITTNFSLVTSYSSFKSNKLFRDALYPVYSSIWQVQPKIDIKISDKFSGIYTSSLLMNSQRTKRDESVKSSVFRLQQKADCYYYPDKKLIIHLQVEHLYNEFTAVKFNHFFADVSINYQLKNGLELSFSYTNIFNQDGYSYTATNELDTYSYVYKLRPASILAGVSFRY
jgi:hypothetical protein